MISSTPLEVDTPLAYTIASQAKIESVDWLWRPYMPKGGLTMVMGDGGYGKSFMTCALAADLSAGRPLPGQDAIRPQKILMISGEDGIGPVILPRLTQLDANLDNIAIYDEGFALNPKMVKKILLAIEEFDAAVVFLDPLVVYMGGDVDGHKANEVRGIISQLTTIAKHMGIAIVVVHHVNKGGASGQHKALGSVDYINSMRSAVMVDMSKTGTYFMSHVKSNWAQKGNTLAYTFTGDKFHWLGMYNEVYDDGGGQEISRTPRGKARAFLLNILADGPVPMLEVAARAKDEGLSETTLQKAKRGVCHSVRLPNGPWVWELDEGIEKRPPLTEAKAEDLIAAMAQVTPPEGITLIQAPGESEMDRLLREARERLH